VFVTVIIDLTPVLDGTGGARLLDLVPGRSSAALKAWLRRPQLPRSSRGRGDGRARRLQDRDHRSPARGHTGDGSLPRRGLASAQLDRAASASSSRPAGTADAPGIRSTGYDAHCAPGYLPLTTRQKARPNPLFVDEGHIAVELCWGFYQRLIGACLQLDRRHGKTLTPRQDHGEHDHRCTAQWCP
jgi:hypothetical protein